jgi:hypothetical protein
MPIQAVSSVIIRKEALRDGRKTALTYSNPMYLYAMRLLLERVSWCVEKAGGTEVITTFAEVKGFRSINLHTYRERLEVPQSPPVTINWEFFEGHPFNIGRPAEVELLQIADTVASGTFRAVEPGGDGKPELSYLRELRPKLFRGYPGPITTYGLVTFPRRVSHPGGPLEYLRKF